jgi:nucleotide-binding universal stress UspA family protein
MSTPSIETESASLAEELARRKKTIIAPIDIVNGMSPALEFAIELAKKWQASLYVMYVYPEVPRVSGARLFHAVPSVDWERYRLSVELQNLVEQIRQRYARVFAYFTDNDCPAEAIQMAASKVSADLIVVSAHHRGWLAKLLLYSDTDAIARRSNTPVLVYRPKLVSKT